VSEEFNGLMSDLLRLAEQCGDRCSFAVLACDRSSGAMKAVLACSNEEKEAFAEAMESQAAALRVPSPTEPS